MSDTPFLLHALSPLHAGTGQGVGVVDLPIARMAATGIPIVPGSSIKGVLRDTRADGRPDKASNPSGYKNWLATELGKKWLGTFGPEITNAADHAGAARFSDARLLALPVRSFKGTFAWVTSPLLLTLAKRDLGALGANLVVPPIASVPNSIRALTTSDCCVQDGKLYLQDLDLVATVTRELDPWANRLKELVCPNGEDIFTKRFVMVDDDTMSFLSETCTQIDTRVSIDSQTGTAIDGALWTEESLPPETLLVGLMHTELSRSGVSFSAAEIRDFATPAEETTIQFGGKATVGKGRCRVMRFDAAKPSGVQRDGKT